ncbi:aldolase/citrate lyase family protein [Microbacterium elymi]|uniref:Aldolase/citrate lyase family protein n=1 Tax=Microbacterium elymi TaxID=2909587 RepID=A0ABY5NN30_9MICO|nr:aldolase/citrate lyase family protein [Microbacterium elymi]UUT36604.1 aldolase/citrate lyase family protein [Microbacterium elymi]
MVRVPALDAAVIQRVLDAGADGIMVPHIDTPEQARAAASAVRFPPLGARGVGATSRAGDWGAMPREEYVRFGREEAALIAQLESAEAIAHAGAIADVPGVDALLVGTADLSMSEGLDESDPRVRAMTADAVAQASTRGMPVGCAGAASAEAVQTAVDAGLRFMLMGNDAGLLGAAARTAVERGRTVRFT